MMINDLIETKKKKRTIEQPFFFLYKLALKRNIDEYTKKIFIPVLKSVENHLF